jgi:DNA-binding XRE family transcriptional regulator
LDLLVADELRVLLADLVVSVALPHEN